MAISRRQVLTIAAGAGFLPALGATAARVRNTAGQGGRGAFRNPVLAGDHPDPAVLKDGDNYYASFSSFDYYPGIVLWHSRDLVNWRPIGPALKQPIGSIYALDLIKHGGRYFIYIPAVNLGGWQVAGKGEQRRSALSIYVIHANNIAGPWSEPVEMGIQSRVDPGHVVGEDGKRYLYFNDGYYVPISDDGLSAAGSAKKVYEGWKYPSEWIDEGFGLEGPKLLRRNGWFYLFSAQGGTAGPPTSHMVVVARSRSVHGPWENCPHNPIVRTRSIAEPWWSRGHATPVEGPDGKWWFAYHGYENGYRSLGRQMLLEPFEWTSDGWPRAKGGDLSKPLARPGGSAPRGERALMGRFEPDMLGTELAFFRPKPGYDQRATFEAGALRLQAHGAGPADASPLAFITGDHRYEFSVEIELHAGAQAGLLLFYDEKLFCGVAADDKRLHRYKLGKPMLYPPGPPSPGSRLRLKVVNEDQVASFYVAQGESAWTRLISFEVAGYNHNMAGGFLSLRPALFVSGAGHAIFRQPQYRGTRTRV